MRSWGHGSMRRIAGCLVLLLVVLFVSAGALPAGAQNSSERTGAASPAPAQSAKSNSTAPSEPATFPNSPGAVRSQVAENDAQFTSQQPPAKEQQAQEPVGTAAAESVETTGVAASKPAGAAIAPAKQRRTRAILIKVGAIVGAGVAIGTVAALSSASPSRPPGAR